MAIRIFFIAASMARKHGLIEISPRSCSLDTMNDVSVRAELAELDYQALCAVIALYPGY